MNQLAQPQNLAALGERVVTLDHLSSDDIYGEGKSPGFDIRYYVSLVRANIMLIALMLGVALALAVVMTMLQTPRYTARASVQINDQSERILKDQEDSSASVNASYDVDRFLQTQIDILNSRGLAVRVMQKMGLTGNARFYKAVQVEAPAPGTDPRMARELTIAMLRSNLAAKLPRNSRVTAITYESTDPEMSAQIANGFAGEFIQANLQRRYDSSAYARDFVSNQLNEAKARLETSERAVNSYARVNGLIRTRDAVPSPGPNGATQSGGGSSVTTASLLQINSAANDAQSARIAAEGRWKAIAGVPLLSAREVLSNASVQQLTTERGKIDAALEQERARHLEDHPTVLQLRAQLGAIDAQIQRVARSVRDSIRSDYLAATSTEQALGNQVESLKSETLAEQDRLVQYNLLAREADTNRALYDGLLQRFKELNAAAGLSASNISIIDEAEAPSSPSSPNLMKNIAFALFGATILAMLVVFLKSQFDDTVHVPEDVEGKLMLPLLGVVPKTQTESPEQELLDPKSPISESYNSLRGALIYATSHGLPRTLLITSSQPAEGKTTTSWAIANSLARMGRRVVLIDVDLRRPSLHHKLDGENGRGMSNLLTSVDPVLSAVRETGIENLSIITSGPIPPSPTELLSSVRMEAVLAELVETYDIVILDCPPVLGLADAPLMSALVEGVVFVVEADRGRRGSLKASLRRLRAMQPTILGAVLTMFDVSKGSNRYSEYYGYDYYQYSGKDKANTKAAA